MNPYEEKQFQLAIYSLGGAAATWTFMLASFYKSGGFTAPAWFILASGTLSMFHVGLISAYMHYEMRIILSEI